MNYLPQPPARAELVVIGGGVVGAATAWYAARAGLRPLIIESRPALCSLTTPASTGAFRLQFDNEEELTLVRESVDLFLHFKEATDQEEYDLDIQQQGYLWLTTSEARVGVQRRLVERQHGWGQTEIELLDGDEVRRRFPYVSANVLQARFRADDGFLDTKQLTMGLVAASDAEVVVDCKAVGFEIAGDRLVGVRTTGGTIATATAVIAAGPLSGLLADTAGIDLPITTVRRQKVVMPDVPEVPPLAPMTIDEDSGAHWRPALGGANLLFTDPATPPSPPAEDVPTDQRFAFQLLDPSSPVSVARVAPFWRDVWERNSANWFVQAGQYTVTPDHRPLIGPTGIEGLYVNTGYSGHGIMGSAAGGRILIDLVVGRSGEAENPFRPRREFEMREPPLL